MKRFKKGDLVRVRCKNWWLSSGQLGVIICRTYLAYENRYSRWKVLVENEIREVTESQIMAERRIK